MKLSSPLGIALLVLWAAWATWSYTSLYTVNQQLSAALGQSQAAYGQLQQQAQQAVDQLQGQIKQMQPQKLPQPHQPIKIRSLEMSALNI
jgi:hypothetical protein